jgi:hypothetical protein
LSALALRSLKRMGAVKGSGFESRDVFQSGNMPS